MRISSLGLLSVMVMLPSPTSLLPDQRKRAPLPDVGPSKEFWQFGSIFVQGDQGSQRWKSLTSAKTAAGGAAIVADRATWKSAGCTATTMARMPISATRPSRTLVSNRRFLRGGLADWVPTLSLSVLAV